MKSADVADNESVLVDGTCSDDEADETSVVTAFNSGAIETFCTGSAIRRI